MHRLVGRWRLRTGAAITVKEVNREGRTEVARVRFEGGNRLAAVRVRDLDAARMAGDMIYVGR